ncbi:MAG: bacterial transcriptional activator domain-containing protein, partial [Candidatus Eremiobacterota bacterium]
LTADPDPEVRRAAQRLNRSASLPVLRIRSLGPFEVVRGDETVSWKTMRVKPSVLMFLTAYLAVHPQGVPRERVADEFWPDQPEKGRRHLTNLLSLLRQCLRPPDWEGELDYVARSQELLALQSDAYWHDLDELDDCCRQAARLVEQGQAEEASRRYQRAAQLYRGPYLEECPMDWAQPVRSRAERQALEAMGFLGQHLLKTGRPREALEQAVRLLEVDPCRQEAHLCATQAYLAMRQYADAVRQFETCRRILRRELGMEPSLEMLEAYQRARLSLA